MRRGEYTRVKYGLLKNSSTAQTEQPPITARTGSRTAFNALFEKIAMAPVPETGVIKVNEGRVNMDRAALFDMYIAHEPEPI